MSPTGAKDTNTARTVTVAGLLAAAVGIGLAKAGGMEMPLVPPGAVLLVAGALLVGILRRRWTGYVAILVALAEIIPSAIAFGSVDGAGEAIGNALRFLGAVTALVGGVALVTARRRRTGVQPDGSASRQTDTEAY